MKSYNMKNKFLPEDESTWGTIEPLGEYSMRPDIFKGDPYGELESMGYDKRKDNLQQHFATPEVSKVRSFSRYRTHTGKTLVDKLNSAKPDLVIDAGCGMNYFGTRVDNCIGIDFIGYDTSGEDDLSGPDIVMDINDAPKIFKQNCADFIICVGPFNFGPKQQIEDLLETFKYLLKDTGTIIGHLRPGQILDEEKSAYRGYHHMPWTTSLAKEVFKKAGLVISWIGEEATDLTWMDDKTLASHLEAWLQAHVSISGPPSSEPIDPRLNNRTLKRNDIISNIQNEIYRRSDDERYDPDRPYYIRSRIAIELKKG